MNFTLRQDQVLNLLKEGKSNIEIGDTLRISQGTAKSHIANMLQKSECKNRTELSYKSTDINVIPDFFSRIISKMEYLELENRELKLQIKLLQPEVHNE